MGLASCKRKLGKVSLKRGLKQELWLRADGSQGEHRKSGGALKTLKRYHEIGFVGDLIMPGKEHFKKPAWAIQ